MTLARGIAYGRPRAMGRSKRIERSGPLRRRPAARAARRAGRRPCSRSSGWPATGRSATSCGARTRTSPSARPPAQLQAEQMAAEIRAQPDADHVREPASTAAQNALRRSSPARPRTTCARRRQAHHRPETGLPKGPGVGVREYHTVPYNESYRLVVRTEGQGRSPRTGTPSTPPGPTPTTGSSTRRSRRRARTRARAAAGPRAGRRPPPRRAPVAVPGRPTPVPAAGTTGSSLDGRAAGTLYRARA